MEKVDDLNPLKGDESKFLTFILDKEFYGIEIAYVTEIVGIQPITIIPETPKSVKGVINLRGEIIPVLDARIRFGKETTDYNDRTCIIVVDIDKLQIGLIVDEVSEVMDINHVDLVPPPKLTTHNNYYIKALAKANDRVTVVIDCKHLLNSEQIDLMINSSLEEYI
ncbi:MAG: purine-binding chemotaxis protein CheW [Clostridia bacterium]|nr:purine-binding chemotaxis protein CheW [Clostridia bacterium]